MNSELLLEMLYVASISSIISAAFIQKIKELFLLGKTFNSIISFITSYIIGFFYALSFYSPVILYAVWIGVFTLIGAESLYKTFKGFFGLNSVSNQKK